MSKFWKVILSVCLLVYPVFIFLTLVVFEKDMRVVSLGMMIIGVLALILNFNGGNKVTPLIMCICALVFIITKSDIVIKFYPCWITAVFGWMFLSSLIHKDPIILKFAKLWDVSIPVHPGYGAIERYCITWNWIWVGFFVLQLVINLYLAVWGSSRTWAIYNGLVSYLLQGLMFILQFGVNFFFNRNLDRRFGFDRRKARSELKAQKEAAK
ncbi:MAG: hypothetical protein IJ863_05810 [Spirochaetales bacterium]|nr:hypothetical protein [Spirochaetales bacterium]